MSTSRNRIYIGSDLKQAKRYFKRGHELVSSRFEGMSNSRRSMGYQELSEAEFKAAEAEKIARQMQESNGQQLQFLKNCTEPTDFERYARSMYLHSEGFYRESLITRIRTDKPELAPVFSKLRMAKRRLAELQWFMWAYFVHTPYLITCEKNAAGTEHRLYVQFEIEPDFLLWGNLLGEFVTDLRSCLDQLIYVLNFKCSEALQPNAGVVDPQKATFPIDGLNGNWAESGKPPPEIRWLDERIVRIIEKVQPFNSHHDSPERSPFMILHKLCNTDKHREPLPVRLRPEFANKFDPITGRGPYGDDLLWFGKESGAEPDGEIGHFVVSPQHEIQIDREIALYPVIEAIDWTGVGVFDFLRPEVPSSSVQLPFDIEISVSKLLRDICNEMGWDAGLISKWVGPHRSEPVVRSWLPGIGNCKPFVLLKKP